jgi:hypothetical protein
MGPSNTMFKNRANWPGFCFAAPVSSRQNGGRRSTKGLPEQTLFF